MSEPINRLDDVHCFMGVTVKFSP